jgi:glycosyltransferase involved in cell wall biosynthesis
MDDAKQSEMLTVDEIRERISHRSFYSGILHNNPKPIKGQAEPQVIFFKQQANTAPIFSVVVPVFNQEEIIEKNIRSIITTMEGEFELIIILDGCVDETETILLHLLAETGPPNLARSILIRQETPVFETTCDNIGFLSSSGPYILEIQADMEMTEYGFNANLARGMEEYDDIIAVSGRCTHAFGSPIGVGKLGELIEKPLDPGIDRNTMHMHGTCNRGPLLINMEKLTELGFLDEQNYFLLDSDHDLFARALEIKGWKCGYIPIEFNSSLKDGSARKPIIDERVRSLNQQVLQLKSERPNNGFLTSVDRLKQPAIETRPLRGDWRRAAPISHETFDSRPWRKDQ